MDSFNILISKGSNKYYKFLILNNESAKLNYQLKLFTGPYNLITNIRLNMNFKIIYKK